MGETMNNLKRTIRKHVEETLNETIRFYEDMPRKLEKYVNSIRLTTSGTEWTFDAKLSDLQRMSIELDIPMKNFPDTIPDYYGVDYSFQGKGSYDTIYFGWGIYIPFNHRGMMYYAEIVKDMHEGSPDEFNLMKGKDGQTYLRIWWD